MQITRPTTPVTVLCLLIAATVFGCQFGPKFTATATKALRDTGTTFSIDAVTNTGSITVQGDEAASGTTVTARFVCGGKSDQEAQQRAHETTLDVTKLGDGTLRVRATFPKPHMSGDSAAFDITVPMLSGAIVRSDTGRISVTNVRGAVDARTDTGRISISKCTGSALARGDTGRIAVTSHSGPVDAKTNTGSVTIELTDQSTAAISGTTDTGSVSLSVGPAFHGVISADTDLGSINLTDEHARISARELQKRSGTITIGSGGERSSLRTDVGSITINVR
jgi:DUF4097 and DUF4098 domain-containing protein YvlB